MFNIDLDGHTFAKARVRAIGCLYGGFVIAIILFIITGILNKSLTAAAVPAVISAIVIGLEIVNCIYLLYRYYEQKTDFNQCKNMYPEVKQFIYKKMQKVTLSCLITAFMYNIMIFGIFVNITITNEMNEAEALTLLICGFVILFIPCVFNSESENDIYIKKNGQWHKKIDRNWIPIDENE